MKEKSVAQIFREFDELIEEMEKVLGYSLPKEPKETLTPKEEREIIGSLYNDYY